VRLSKGDIGADRCYLAIELARASTTGVAFEHESMLLRQSLDPLSVDRGQTLGSSLALAERGDPPIVRRHRTEPSEPFDQMIDQLSRSRPAAPKKPKRIQKI
jgi:hypothetical protein